MGLRGGLGIHTPPSQRGHLCHARVMPRPRREPSPDERQAALPLAKAPARRAPPTPEAIAKIVVAKLTSPVGFPDKAEVTPRLSLPRAVCERLMARASREGYPSFAAWVQAVLEREGKH